MLCETGGKGQEEGWRWGAGDGEGRDGMNGTNRVL